MLNMMINKYMSNYKPDIRDLGIMFVFGLFYLSWTSLVIGLRNDHLSFLLFIVACMLISTFSRKIVYTFVFFILFWIIYDSMRIFPNYEFGTVRIEEPYLIEKSWFGITDNGQKLTPNEYFESRTTTFLDIISGLFYLTWVPVPLALGFYFFFTDKMMLLRFSAAYLFTNLIGFCIYYLYPAAPPWYYEQYGTEQLFNITGSPAGLARFDEWVGYPVFTNIYTRNSNVFAAVPSLHAAYPVVAWFYAGISRMKKTSALILVDIVGIWFAAVYSFHHYFIDVLLGAACAAAGIFLFEKMVMKTSFSKWLKRYILFIENEKISSDKQAPVLS
jgi:inositol phosphorylceramide synthase catalytic subunit